jgi:hypothetical protein
MKNKFGFPWNLNSINLSIVRLFLDINIVPENQSMNFASFDLTVGDLYWAREGTERKF